MPIRFVLITLALAFAACGDEAPAFLPDTGSQPDASTDPADAGEDAPDASDEAPPDGGEDSPDAGEDSPDAGEDSPDGGDEQSQQCGTRLSRRCPTGEYCKFDLEAQCGAFDTPGVCTPIPEPICPPVVRPVCGCDGVTYSSACDAAVAGVSVAAEGACVKPGCEAQDAMEEGDRDTSLGFAWDGATCVELVGGKCVGDDCDAVFWSKAACLSHYLEAECYQPVVCGGRFGADCADDEFCDYPDGAMCGATDLPGICWPRPVARYCDVMDEQCGCDGETYANECYAQASGVDVMYPGPCATPECRAQNARGDWSSETLLGWGFNGYDCAEQYGECEGPDCEALFADRAACLEHYLEQGCIEPTPCNAAMSSCSPLDYCDYDSLNVCGLTDGDGVCRPRPQICERILAPVCACDGQTYSNDCEAARAGVDVSAQGSCECQGQDVAPVGICKAVIGFWWNGAACVAMEACSCAGTDCIELDGDSRPPYTDEAACLAAVEVLGCTVSLRACGGRAGLCGDTEFCDFHLDGDCGESDGQGVCRPRPEVCQPAGNTVCGCNGETYGSVCEAQSDGTDVKSAGACR